MLGFFHAWIAEFAKQCDTVTVICLQEGAHHLPSNVTVLSLGKEQHQSRLSYIRLFYRYVLTKRHEYDTVFVHMNDEYIVLGGFLWRLLGKRIQLWRNHGVGGPATYAAAFFSHVIFYTAPQSFTARFRKARRMPAGIDTESFRPAGTHQRRQSGAMNVVAISRRSPSKRIDLMVDAIRQCRNNGMQITFHHYGDAPAEQGWYSGHLNDLAQDLIATGCVRFYDGVPHETVPEIYRDYDVCLNAATTGCFDKTVLEGMACGCPAIVSSADFSNGIDTKYIFSDATPEALSQCLHTASQLSDPEYSELAQRQRNYVIEHHNLTNLVREIVRA